MGPSQRQEAVKALQKDGLSQREACRIMRARRRSPKEMAGLRSAHDGPLLKRLTHLAQQHPRYGCKRLYVIYERVAGEGDPYMNYKRFRRLYRLANLQIARRRRRSRAKYVRGTPLHRAERPNDIWTMDFVSDRLLHGRVFRALTLLDECSRYAMAVDPAFSYLSVSVVRTLRMQLASADIPSFARRQRPGIHRFCARNVGVRAQCRAAFHSARQAYTERLHRIIQLPRTRRIARRKSVPNHLRGADRRGRMAPRIQHWSSA